MAIFRPKPWVNPWHLSTFWTFCFYSLGRNFFVLEYRKRHFPCLYCMKRKGWKMAIFGLKPWVNPFAKMSIFRGFKLLLFIAYIGVFSFYNIVKEIFLDYIAQKKSGKNGHFWPKPWVNLFGKISIFRLFEDLVFIA